MYGLKDETVPQRQEGAEMRKCAVENKDRDPIIVYIVHMPVTNGIFPTDYWSC